MTTQSNTAQNPGENQATTKKEAKRKPKLRPDFKHRLGLFDGDATPHNLADAVDTLALQADGILNLVNSQFLGGEETDCHLSDDVIFYSIDSAINIIKDIKAIVNAYQKANANHRA